MRTQLGICALCLLASLATVPAAEQPTYPMAEYWITPQGRYTTLVTHKKLGGTPGCPGTVEEGTHAFWQGSFLGRALALQGGKDFHHPGQGYDVFSLSDAGEIMYWGTFRGNEIDDQKDKSNAFERPVVFMNPHMKTRQDMGGVEGPENTVSGSTIDHEMTNSLRNVTGQGNWYYALTVEEHIAGWRNEFDPERQAWPDVLRVVYYFGNSPNRSGQYKEEYWLQKGVGTIAFKSYNPDEPSCVDFQYALNDPEASLPEYSQVAPAVPWYDPFHWATYVPNGFFEDLISPPQSQVLSGQAASWTGYSGSPGAGQEDSEDVIATGDGPPLPGGINLGGSRVALRVAPNVGWDLARSAAFDVTPGATYTLSGWLNKGAEGDQVYLDMDDVTADPSADNVYAAAIGWQHVTGLVSVGCADRVRVRCVRDTGNSQNAYCDGITLQLSGQSGECQGGGGGGSSSGPGCNLNGTCDPGETYVRLLPDGTTIRETTCPEDCPSCGFLGGDYCAPAGGTCPSGHVALATTYDCTPCCVTCASTGCPPGSCGWQTDNCGAAVWCGDCLQSCGQMGGNHCSQTGSCPPGHSSLGLSRDCNPCCYTSLQSCGQMGGNYCSQTGSCPAGHNSLGLSSDCNPCCKSCVSTGCPPGSCGWKTDNCGRSIWCGSCLQSCGQKGGDYCSQTASCPVGYDSLGPSSDCTRCCKRGPSCGSAGGDYCSQSGSCPQGSQNLGSTWDCRPCCRL